MIKEFKAFIMRGNVVDLAVGVIIGAAFGKIVSSLVNDVLMPPIGALIGGIDFSDLALTLKAPIGSVKPVTIRYGLFINNVIDFLIVAFCVFLVVKAVNSLQKQPPTPTQTEKKCPQCAMLVPIEAKRCGHCTSTIA
jgi:large conductance mechanosensitive channel